MITKNKKRAEKFVNNNLQRNQYQGHISWCMDSKCYGVNFFSIKSYDTKWISRILNDPTLQCIPFIFKLMNGELNAKFYRELREGQIDRCVTYISGFLWKIGNKVRKESLKELMKELLIHEERFDED